MPRRRVAICEHAVERIRGARCRIDIFWPGELVVERKSRGRGRFGTEPQAIALADLDRAVDRLNRPQGFASDRARAEHPFALSEAMVAPLLAARVRKPARRRRGA